MTTPGTRMDRRQSMKVMSWVMRKYVRFLVLGALSSCAFVSLALHAGAGLYHYCQDECFAALLKGPLPSMDILAVEHIRNHWVDPPAPKGSYKPDFSVDIPPWSSMDSWGAAYNIINDLFKSFKISFLHLQHKSGTFMEIGAGDGEFRSLTLYVEQKLGFRGVLVEANPELYRSLRAVRRSAFSVNACATPDLGHRKTEFWVRHTPKNLPRKLYRIQRGSSRLLEDVLVEERIQGYSFPVQCFNAGAIASAALGTKVLDLVTISTQGGELDILDSIPTYVRIKMVVLMMPLAGRSYLLEEVVDRRGLTSIFHDRNINIFILKSMIYMP